MAVIEIREYSECFSDHICQKMGFNKAIRGFRRTVEINRTESKRHPKTAMIYKVRCDYYRYTVDGPPVTHFDFKPVKVKYKVDQYYWVLLCEPIKVCGERDYICVLVLIC